MRLTAELVEQHGDILFSPANERELRLRQLQIAVIENLGCTKDQFDCIDLSDNEILRIDGTSFPVLTRLRTLILNNNRINRVGNGLGSAIPRLESLVLTRNSIASLEDLDGLAELGKSLVRLSLLGNPVTKVSGYREKVLSLCPKLRSLDFGKIPQKERDAVLQKKKGQQKKMLTDQQKQFLLVTSLSELYKNAKNTLDCHSK